MSFVERYINVKARRQHPAILIVYAALCAVAMLIPGIPTLGTGSTMSLAYPLGTLAGILFGPYAGALVTTIGGLVGTLIAPHAANLGIWTFTTQAWTAFMTGYIARGKWQLPAVGSALCLIVLYTYPAIQEAWWFGWVALHGIVLSIPFAIFLAPWLKSKNVGKLSVAVFCISYVGYIAGTVWSDNLGIPMYDLTSELYGYLLAWLMPIERLIFSLFTTVLGVPLLLGLPKIKVYVGPAYDASEEGVVDDVDKSMQEKLGR